MFKKSIDINCDMGEGVGNDEDLMPYITSANIACGYHAGNKESIKKTILLAKNSGVRIGAHPSFFDKKNFGRTEIQSTAGDVYNIVTDQLKLFQKIANDNECKVHHVKPHGALYNMAARDAALANAISQAVKDVDENLILYGLSCSILIREAEKMGLKAWNEVFADRTYQDDGSLTPRTHVNALIEDAQEAVLHVKEMVINKKIITVSRSFIPVVADTICIHGDGKNAVGIAKAVFEFLYNPSV